MSYKTEFDYGRFNIDPKILALGLNDISWGNDMGPSWQVTEKKDGTGIILMVFEEKAEDREMPEFKRYSVYSEDLSIYIGDDTDEVVQLIKILRKNYLERK